MGETLRESSSLTEKFCMKFPKRKDHFDINIDLIPFLPKFHGFVTENPYLHLRELRRMSTLMNLQKTSDDEVCSLLFPLSLDGSAKDWLYTLPPCFLCCWKEMQKTFIEKYFPASLRVAIQREITGIEQYVHEDLSGYWMRYERLCASCPHQFPDYLLLLYFYDGLMPIYRSMLDIASGGTFMDKTPLEGRKLIERMTSNSYSNHTEVIFSIDENQNHGTQRNEDAVSDDKMIETNSDLESSCVGDAISDSITVDFNAEINCGNCNVVEVEMIENDNCLDLIVKTETTKDIKNDFSDISCPVEPDLYMLDDDISQIDVVVSGKDSSILQVKLEKEIITAEKSNQKEPSHVKATSFSFFPLAMFHHILEKVAAILEGSWHLPLLLFGEQRKEEANDGVQRFLTYHTP